MAKMYFNKKELSQLNEVLRRLIYLHKGNLNTTLLIPCVPSNAKHLIKLNLIKPVNKVTPRVLNWYNLTELGKKYFSFYKDIEITDETNTLMFNKEFLFYFDYSAFNGLKK